MVNIPLKVRENVLMYFGDRGKTWIDNLPELLEIVAQNYQLTLLEPYSNLSVNYVTPAIRSDGQRVVLKIGVPNKDISTEIAALSCFGGIGAVQLLDSDAERGLLILEELTPGISLQENPGDMEAAELAVEVMRAIWQPTPAQHDFPNVADWFTGLADVRTRYHGGTGPFPRRLFEMAERCSVESLASTETQMLLHGDCHHENILYSEAQGWLAIDPKGIIGDPVFELCAFLRNPLDVHERFDIKKALPQRARWLSDLLGFDLQRIVAWGVAGSDIIGKLVPGRCT